MAQVALIVAYYVLAALHPLGVRAQAPPPPDPRFGIVEAYANSAAATEAGAGYSRVIIRWDVIQPAGSIDWKPANVPDPYVAAELAAGRQVVGLLIGTPAWATEHPEHGARAVPRANDWAAFTKRVAEQYRGRIQHWVIWNEPDVWEVDHPGSTWAGSVEDYFGLLKTAYLSIKGVDPGLTVTLAGLTYFWDFTHGRPQYLERLLDAISADPEAPANGYYFDAVVYHLYFRPAQAPEIIGWAQSALRHHNIPGKEIWVNETNAPPSDDPPELPWSAPRFKITLDEQAAFILQQYALAFAAGAGRVEVYKLRNSADHPESIEPFGLLRGDNSRRPAFDAYRVATTYLGGFRSAQAQRQGSLYAVTFDRGAQSTTVLWTTSRGPAQARVRAIAARGLLVDERGTTRPIAAVAGVYTLSLPGAICANSGDCFIGGAPRLLVEAGAAAGRQALLAAALTATPSQTPSAAPTAPQTHTPAASPTATAGAQPTATATPTAMPPASPIPTASAAATPSETPVPAEPTAEAIPITPTASDQAGIQGSIPPALILSLLVVGAWVALRASSGRRKN